MTQTVLILGGNGKIGTHAAEAFWDAGWTVCQYTRGTDMTEAAQGADVIVNGLNPPNYNNWAVNIPAITRQVISAASASGATVIIPGNVYNFGDTDGTWDEMTPHRPVTEKGRIRVEMEAAYRASGVRTIILRAGHFIDPNRKGDAHSILTMAKVHRGKITALGGVDVVQAHAYLPDWARAAVRLAEIGDTLAPFEDVPFPGHAFSLTDVKTTLEEAMGRPMRFSQFPWWATVFMAPFSELIREFRKMRYLYDTSHRLGATAFDRLLPGFQATDLRTVILAGLAPDIHPDKVVRSGGQTVAAE